MNGRLPRVPTLQKLLQAWPWWLLVLALVGVRLSKGAVLSDAYALLSRPFWPGTAQREWLQAAARLSDQTRLVQLEQDNRRLRGLLDLQRGSGAAIPAPVISRGTGGWWQQLELGKGQLDGIAPGDPVLGPGGLLGLVQSVTPSTARVRLLTDPGSHVGVWVGRTRRHGLLIGQGTARPVLHFLDKDTGVRPGDVVSTSPASTLLPANVSVGVVQSVNDRAVPAPEAVVQLGAPLDAVDWVQVTPRRPGA